MKLLNSAAALLVLMVGSWTTAYANDNVASCPGQKAVQVSNMCTKSESSFIKVQQQQEPQCDRIKCKWYPQNVWAFIPGCRGC